MPHILTINAGSSSVRFAIFSSGERPVRLLDGKMERVGGEAAAVTADRLAQRLKAAVTIAGRGGSGHRVVHGMQHNQPERVSPSLLTDLRSIASFDPEHLPREIELIEAMQRRYPDVPQVACFDTAFHRGMPAEATLLPIPRRYAAKGVQRYGFHGLSYTFLMQELARLGDRAASRGRVILAHLGSGASLAAVLDGRCIDTSMGFTPVAGLLVGARSRGFDSRLMRLFILPAPMGAGQ